MVPLDSPTPITLRSIFLQFQEFGPKTHLRPRKSGRRYRETNGAIGFPILENFWSMVKLICYYHFFYYFFSSFFDLWPWQSQTYRLITLFLIVLRSLLYHVKHRKFRILIQMDRASIALSNHIVYILFSLFLVQKLVNLKKERKKFFEETSFRQQLSRMNDFVLYFIFTSLNKFY
jgi:hypothetical protein